MANSACQLEPFDIEGKDALRDGHLALVIAPHATQASLVRAAVGAALGRAQRHEDLALRTARQLVMDPGRPRVLVARDGQTRMMRAPLRIRRRARPLRIIVPGAAT